MMMKGNHSLYDPTQHIDTDGVLPGPNKGMWIVNPERYRKEKNTPTLVSIIILGVLNTFKKLLKDKL